MTSVREAYAALTTVVSSATGLRGYDYVPGSSLWPAFFVLAPVMEYESLAHNLAEPRFDVVVLVSSARDKNQRDLLDYMDDEGPKSIPKAVHDDPSLGGLPGVSAIVLRARPLNLPEQAGYQAYGALFEAVCRLSPSL
jgi:hypothetical protein